ncbi:MAG: transcription antitermination factor NusB [Pseudomonadota bacterium]
MSNLAQPLAARKAALSYTNIVLRGHGDPGMVIDPQGRLSASERSEAKRLAIAVLRHRSNLDTLIQRYANKPAPPSVRQILYLLLVETQLFKTQDFASVHSAVELAKSDPATKGKFSGFVNAVARQLAELPPQTLSTMKPPKLPKPLRGPMIGAYTQPVVERIEAAHTKGAPLDLCFKSGSPLPEISDGQSFAPGHLRLKSDMQVSKLPGYSDGAFWVQDFAAQMPIRALGPVEGLSVLDLCAAPGGKTMQLAAGGANVTALDISEHRMTRLRENLDRTKLTADVIVADALTWEPDAQYDLVVLDAPCSATGTIRRHPDLPYHKGNADLVSLMELQRALTARAAHCVSPGGRLLVITCSLLPKEGEGLAKWTEETLPGLRPDPLQPVDDTIVIDTPNQVRLRPDMRADQGGMDGFFFALYRAEIR